MKKSRIILITVIGLIITALGITKEKKELFSTVYQVNMTNGFELEFNNEGMLTDFDD